MRKHQLAPADAALSEQVGRRLHTLYASAQVFQEQALVEGIKLALAGIETSRLERRPPTPGELDAVLALCDELPADGERRAAARLRPSRARRARRGCRPSRRMAWTAIPRVRAIDRSRFRTASRARSAAPELLAILVIAGSDDRTRRPRRAARGTVRADEQHRHRHGALGARPRRARRGADRSRAARARRRRAGRAAARRSRARCARGDRDRPGAERGDRLACSAARASTLRCVCRCRASGLLARLQRWANPNLEAWQGLRLSRLQSGTVDEIARGVAEEIQRGISGSLVGRSERIELADNTELLAATWSAIARIRAHLEQRAAGRVRFEDAPYAGGPSALALTESTAPAAELPALPDEPLRGRRRAARRRRSGGAVVLLQPAARGGRDRDRGARRTPRARARAAPAARRGDQRHPDAGDRRLHAVPRAQARPRAVPRAGDPAVVEGRLPAAHARARRRRERLPAQGGREPSDPRHGGRSAAAAHRARGDARRRWRGAGADRAARRAGAAADGRRRAPRRADHAARCVEPVRDRPARGQPAVGHAHRLRWIVRARPRGAAPAARRRRRPLHGLERERRRCVRRSASRSTS